MVARHLVISALALGFLVLGPMAAGAATPVHLSGKHTMYCCDFPAAKLFGQPAFGAPAGYWTAYFTGKGLTPAAAKNAGVGLAKLDAIISETGASYKTLLVSAGKLTAQVTNSMATPMTPKFISLSSKLSWSNASAVLAPGGSWPSAFAGASTWSFCPSAVGPGTTVGGSGCLAPISAGPAPRNGRIVRKALRPSKFGGTMALIGGNVVKISRRIASGTPKYNYAPSNVINDALIGGAAASASTVVWPAFLRRTTLPTSVYNVYTPLTFTFRGAGPWGTGYVGIQATKNQPSPLQTISVGVSGYDSRNASGRGNLQLVSGILYNGISVPGTVLLGNVITVALPEPAPAMGVAAGAFALAFLGLRRARSRR